MQRTSLVTIAALLALTGSPGMAQSVGGGSLLAAAPGVTSFRFARSIVFVVHHDEEGSLGLIVNRPTRLDAAETFDGLAGLSGYEGRVYVGGPLEPTRPLLLVNDTSGVLSERPPVYASIHVAADAEAVREHADRLTDEATVRVYAGHVQWGPGQLEREISAGTWNVLPGSVDAVFSSEPLELYRRIGSRDSELVAAQRERADARP